jgi:hypothetical protein
MPRHWRSAPCIGYATTKWAEIEPLARAPLTACEVLVQRLELAQEMVELMLQDGQDLAGVQGLNIE